MFSFQVGLSSSLPRGQGRAIARVQAHCRIDLSFGSKRRNAEGQEADGIEPGPPLTRAESTKHLYI